MQIQLINKFKLKINFNIKDLEENNITLHSFMAGSTKSKRFLKAIIQIAEEDFGIIFSNLNFNYETFCFNFFEFTILVSFYETPESLNPSTKNSELKSFKFIDNYLTNNFSTNCLYYTFKNFENFLEFVNYFQNNFKLLNINSILYKYNNIFLLEIIHNNLSKNELNTLLLSLSETQDYLDLSEVSIAHIKEFSKILISNNALNYN